MYVKDPFATVAAVSTPHGKGGISVIRISGPDTGRIVEKCFKPKNKKRDIPLRTAVYGDIIKDGAPIDSGICVLYGEGRSFTGESMAELSCHGGIYVTGEVLSAVFAAGAEPAGPGEFTRRAFVNGKMTLTEAEAVGKLIDADTKSRAELAAGAVRGNLSSRLADISSKLFDAMTALYAAIDYPEEDVGDEGERTICDAVSETLKNIKKLSDTYKTGKAVSEGVRTVICGKPNAGKSSLYNLLLGEDRAIVTSVAGTTRDILEDTADVGGVTLRLADTAGLHDSDDTVEKIGIERAIEKIENAELILFVADASCPLTLEEKAFAKKTKKLDCEKICIINKSDLDSALGEKDLTFLADTFENTVSLSAEKKTGLEDLKSTISSLFNSERLSLSNDALIWDSLQKASLDRAAELLLEAKGALERDEALDAVGVLCEDALSEVRMVDGKDVSEDIISSIFSRFCVGK